jgi:hypothetical protein
MKKKTQLASGCDRGRERQGLATYVIEYAPALGAISSWHLMTSLLLINNLQNLRDQSAVSATQRFYRARSKQ